MRSAGTPSGKLRSDKAAWSKAGQTVGSLPENISKALAKLEDGQKGLGKDSGCLTAAAQRDVYDSWERYVKDVSGRCGALAGLLEKTGNDQLKTDQAIKAEITELKVEYEDTPPSAARPGASDRGAMDFTTLRALKPSEFSDSADGYRSTGAMASAAKDRIEHQISVAMRNANQGEAANAALKQLQELAQNFHYTQAECGLVGAALDGFAYDMEAAKKKLDVAVENAQAEKFTVHADGSISYPAGGDEVDGKLPEGGTVTGLGDATASAVGRQAANFDPNPITVARRSTPTRSPTPSRKPQRPTRSGRRSCGR